MVAGVTSLSVLVTACSLLGGAMTSTPNGGLADYTKSAERPEFGALSGQALMRRCCCSLPATVPATSTPSFPISPQESITFAEGRFMPPIPYSDSSQGFLPSVLSTARVAIRKATNNGNINRCDICGLVRRSHAALAEDTIYNTLERA